ncbi:hypothetical protein L345_15131, partial [Ophiophagus hannah]
MQVPDPVTTCPLSSHALAGRRALLTPSWDEQNLQGKEEH